MQMAFEMPDTQSWDREFWERLGVGPEWDSLNDAFQNVECQYEDDEELILEFPHKSHAQVRQILQDARDGKYGPDVQTYWKAAVPV